MTDQPAAPVPGEAPEQQGSAPTVRADAEAIPAFDPRPPRLAVDANGYVWRCYDTGWSMCPQNPDNSPIPEPVTYYEPKPPRECKRHLDYFFRPCDACERDRAAVASPAQPAPPESALTGAGEDQSPLALGCGCPWEDYDRAVGAGGGVQPQEAGMGVHKSVDAPDGGQDSCERFDRAGGYCIEGAACTCKAEA